VITTYQRWWKRAVEVMEAALNDNDVRVALEMVKGLGIPRPV